MKFFSCRLLFLHHVFTTFLTVSYFLLGNNVAEVDSSPIYFPSNLNEKQQLLSTFRQLITEIESQDPIVPRQEDDDEEVRRPGDTFPGVANIILGVVTGDLRRVIEDGAFSFLGKEAKENVFSIYHNLLGRTTKATTTTVQTTPTTKPKTVTVNPEASGQVNNRSSKKPPLKYQSANSKTTQKVTTSTTTIAPEIEDEDELVAKFEKIIQPYLPENPDDVIIKDTNFPQF